VEYSKLVEKILDEEPSKLYVYLSLEDVKANAKVFSQYKYLDCLPYHFTSGGDMEPT